MTQQGQLTDLPSLSAQVRGSFPSMRIDRFVVVDWFQGGAKMISTCQVGSIGKHTYRGRCRLGIRAPDLRQRALLN